VKRNGSRSCLNRSRFGSRERDWLREDVGRGCVYVYGGDAVASSDLPSCCRKLDRPICLAQPGLSEPGIV
uniref:Uncharacterized protein n=1 Tax=Athene cunicularia TaxID=194338 RepID=A0A663MUW6_ATHCN